MYPIHRRSQDNIMAKHCVFFAALENQYDTIDRISGNQIVPIASNTMLWNSTLNMWNFNMQGNGNRYAASCQGLMMPFGNPMELTVLGECILNSAMSSVHVNGFIPREIGIAMNGFDYNFVPGTLYKIAFSFVNADENTRYIVFYVNGVETRRLQYSGLISNPGIYRNGVGFMYGNGSGYASGNSYQKNVMFFNIPLTGGEIKKIQKL